MNKRKVRKKDKNLTLYTSMMRLNHAKNYSTSQGEFIKRNVAEGMRESTTSGSTKHIYNFQAIQKIITPTQNKSEYKQSKKPFNFRDFFKVKKNKISSVQQEIQNRGIV